MLQRVHCQIYFQKAQVVLVLECRVGVLQELFDVLPVEYNVERLTYSVQYFVQCRVGALKRAVCNDIDKSTLTINPTLQGRIKQQSIHSGTRYESLRG